MASSPEESGPNTFATVTRWAITHRVSRGVPFRALTFSPTKRNAFDTQEEAQEVLNFMKRHLLTVLTKDEHRSLRADPVPCWKENKIPVGDRFDDT